MNRFLHPYYLLNFLLIFVYPISRVLYINYSPFYQQKDVAGYSRENGIIFPILIACLIKVRKCSTWDHVLSDVFFLGKVAIVAIYIFVNIRFCLLFILACSIVFLFFRQPKYNGPTNIISFTSEEEFEEMVENKKVKGAKSMKETETWLVEFYTDWAESCIYTKPLWAELSLKYSTKLMKFGEVNIMVMQDLAKKYTINTSSMSRQLPSLILFENGKEVIRFPPLDPKTGKVGKVLKYDKKELAKYFDLDKKFLATRGL